MSPLIYSMRITIVSHTVGCMYLSNVHYVRLKSLFICISAQLFFGRKYSLLHWKYCLRLAYIILNHLWSFDVRYIHTYIHHYLFIYINMRVREGKYLRIIFFLLFWTKNTHIFLLQNIIMALHNTFFSSEKKSTYA